MSKERQIQTREELLAFLEVLGKSVPDPLPQFSDQALTAMYTIAYAQYEEKRYEESAKLFKMLTQLDLFTRKHWMGLGASLQMAHRYPEAIEAYGFAALLDEKDPYVHLHAAECFFAMNEGEKGLRALHSVTKVAKGHPHAEFLNATAGDLRKRWSDREVDHGSA